MGGSVYEYDDDSDSEFPLPSSSDSSDVRSVVLVGRSRNGKSATGNSILGKPGFKSVFSFAGVTTTCELQTTLLEDGLTLNVIDTPGLFDFHGDQPEPGFMAKEIVKCMNMAKDGIHAILLVLSLRSHFTIQEIALVASLRKFFGNKISDYIIVVFTRGDELEDNEMTLDDYLGRDCPQPLAELVKMCGNRCIPFNNKTKDEAKKLHQRKQLLSLVDNVAETNGGRPYTNDLFLQLKKEEHKLRNQIAEVDSVKDHSNQEVSELKEQFQHTYEEQLKRITYTVELKVTTHRLEQQLAKEQTARLRAEERAERAEGRALRIQMDEIRRLRKKLERSYKETDELLLVEERAERAQARG